LEEHVRFSESFVKETEMNFWYIRAKPSITQPSLHSKNFAFRKENWPKTTKPGQYKSGFTTIPMLETINFWAVLPSL
jgi:hypothetical protein